MRILIVEDNPGDAELIRILLETITTSKISEITDVDRLQSAIEIVKKQDFDIIILDLGLPDSQGIETLHRIIQVNSNLPIVVLTGNVDDQLGLEALKAGAQDFLNKGQISEQTLGRVLRYAYERKQAEIRQRNTEQKIQTILDALDIQILLLDTNYRIEWPNRTVCEAFGLLRNEIIGKYCWDLWPEQVGKCENCAVEKAITSGQYHTEYRCLMHGKTWDTTACPVYNSRGELTSVVGMRRDISDRVELEEQFFQAQKMEAIGRLAGGVAHDFNNILSIIFGFTDMARDYSKELEPLNECLDEITDASHRAAALVRQLLAFSRKETIDPQVIDCNLLIDGSIKMLKRLIGEDVELKFNPYEKIWKVKIDPTQLEQILINLIVNSRDAILGVGLISIETTNRYIDETYCETHFFNTPGEYVELSVTDTGCGMSKDVISKIFEPFFTTKKQGMGTGLGMSTIFGIVKQNNGMINVYSEVGNGTTVKVYLPRHTGNDQEAAEKQTLSSIEGKETILVVEDDETILRICNNILTEYGYTVLTDNDPLQAVQQVKRYPRQIDLLLSDTIMPKMNGPELLRAITELQPSIKSLYMSGYTADIISYQGILAEGIQFIQKPFTKIQLVEKIRNILNTK